MKTPVPGLVRKLHESALKVLIVGSGSRESVLYELCRSAHCSRVYVGPGNGGVLQEDRAPLETKDVNRLCAQAVAFAKKNNIDLIIVGPEAPLIAGLVDLAQFEGIPAIGPCAKAAALEGSKAFVADLCTTHGIPAPKSWVAFDPKSAREIIARVGAPIVVKADGEAGGKGVVVCESVSKAHEAVDAMMIKRVFGRAGDALVLQKKLVGREVSSFWLCDGSNSPKEIGSACDYKRRFTSGHPGQNPNTGGMGAYSPSLHMDDVLRVKIRDRIIIPALQALGKEKDVGYHGVLYAGLMLVEKDGELEPQLIEFNVRFGDPEAQVLIPRLSAGSLLENLLYTLEPGGLAKAPGLRIIHPAAVGVVYVRSSYPGTIPKEPGGKILGLEETRKAGLQVYIGRRRGARRRSPGDRRASSNSRCARKRYFRLPQGDLCGSAEMERQRVSARHRGRGEVTFLIPLSTWPPGFWRPFSLPPILLIRQYANVGARVHWRGGTLLAG